MRLLFRTKEIGGDSGWFPANHVNVKYKPSPKYVKQNLSSPHHQDRTSQQQPVQLKQVPTPGTVAIKKKRIPLGRQIKLKEEARLLVVKQQKERKQQQKQNPPKANRKVSITNYVPPHQRKTTEKLFSAYTLQQSSCIKKQYQLESKQVLLLLQEEHKMEETLEKSLARVQSNRKKLKIHVKVTKQDTGTFSEKYERFGVAEKAIGLKLIAVADTIQKLVKQRQTLELVIAGILDNWICETCTFDNKNDFNLCDACGVFRSSNK